MMGASIIGHGVDMAKRASTTMKNWLTDQFASQFNGGTIELRSGSQPATGDTTATGVLLVSIPLNSVAFTTSSGGVASINGTWSFPASATGTLGWFRLRNISANRSIDGEITVTGGGGEATVADLNVVVGQGVSVLTFNLQALAGA